MATWQGKVPSGYTLIPSTVFDCAASYVNKVQGALIYKIDTASDLSKRTVSTKTIIWASSEWYFTLYTSNGKGTSTTDTENDVQGVNIVKSKNVVVDYLEVASSSKVFYLNDLKDDKKITLKGFVPFVANGFAKTMYDYNGSYNLTVPKLASKPTFSTAPKELSRTETSIKVDSGYATCFGGTVSYAFSLDEKTWKTSSTNTIEFTNLQPNTTYKVYVKAMNSANTSSLYTTKEVSVTTLGYPYIKSISTQGIMVNGTNVQTLELYNPNGYQLEIGMKYYSANGTTLLNSNFTTSGDKATLTPIKDKAYACIPNSFNGVCVYTCYCRTTNSTRTYEDTFKVPTYSIPNSNISISNISDSGQNIISEYVQGKSKLNIKGSGSPINSAKIVKFVAIIDGLQYEQNTVNNSTAFNISSGFLNTYGLISYRIYFIDSRNVKSIEKTGTITVRQYFSPTLSFTNVPYRCDSSGVQTDTAGEDNNTSVKLFYKYNAAPINNKNVVTFKIQYKRSVDSVWIDLVSFNNYTKSTFYISNPIFSADYYYDFRMSIVDSFSSIIYGKDNVIISTTFTLTNYNASGKGIAFGKVSTGDLFEVALPTIFENSEFGQTIIKRNGSTNGVALGFQNSNGVLGYIGLSGVKDGSLILYSGSSPNDTNKQRTILDSSNWRNYIAIKTVDSVTNAINSTYATYLGKVDKGANNKFMYLDDGLPVESTLSLGNKTKPIYFSNGVVTEASVYCEVIDNGTWVAYKYPNGELSCYRKEAYVKTVSNASDWKTWFTNGVFTIDIDINEKYPVPFTQQPVRSACCQYNSSSTFIAFAGQNNNISGTSAFGRVTLFRTSQVTGTFYVNLAVHGRWS